MHQSNHEREECHGYKQRKKPLKKFFLSCWRSWFWKFLKGSRNSIMAQTDHLWPFWWIVRLTVALHQQELVPHPCHCHSALLKSCPSLPLSDPPLAILMKLQQQRSFSFLIGLGCPRWTFSVLWLTESFSVEFQCWNHSGSCTSLRFQRPEKSVSTQRSRVRSLVGFDDHSLLRHLFEVLLCISLLSHEWSLEHLAHWFTANAISGLVLVARHIIMPIADWQFQVSWNCFPWPSFWNAPCSAGVALPLPWSSCISFRVLLIRPGCVKCLVPPGFVLIAAPRNPAMSSSSSNSSPFCQGLQSPSSTTVWNIHKRCNGQHGLLLAPLSLETTRVQLRGCHETHCFSASQSSTWLVKPV